MNYYLLLYNTIVYIGSRPGEKAYLCILSVHYIIYLYFTRYISIIFFFFRNIFYLVALQCFCCSNVNSLNNNIVLCVCVWGGGVMYYANKVLCYMKYVKYVLPISIF